MTLQSIYEQDKERIISSLSGKSREEVVRIMEAELDRILYAFNDGEESERVRETANALIQTAKAGAGMVDTDGVTRIYGRKEYSGTNAAGVAAEGKISVLFWILLVAGLVCAAPIALLIRGYLSAEAVDTKRIVLAFMPAGSMVLLFLAGLFLRKKSVPDGEQLRAEVLVDPMKVYHHMLAVILVIDKQIEEIRSLGEMRERKLIREQGVTADTAELTLLSQLLEDAYARRGSDDQADEEISSIRFYLHQKRIDTIDWDETEETGHHWFDMIPAYEAGTLRPALVQDGKLLKKGLASEGRRV